MGYVIRTNWQGKDYFYRGENKITDNPERAKIYTKTKEVMKRAITLTVVFNLRFFADSMTKHGCRL